MFISLGTERAKGKSMTVTASICEWFEGALFVHASVHFNLPSASGHWYPHCH